MSSDQLNTTIAMNTLFLPARVRLWVILASGVAMLSAKTAGQSAYDQWIRSFPGISVLNQAPTADPDQDGLANVAEQLLGLNPTIPLGKDPARDNAPALQAGPRGGLQFRYHVNPAADASKEIRHGIQKSGDLQRWQDLASSAALDPGLRCAASG